MLTGTKAGAYGVGRRGPAPGGRAGAALLLVLPLALASAQTLDALAPLPPSAAPFRHDLALLAGHVSAAAAARADQVAAAAADLERTYWALSWALEATPEAGYELDVARDRGGWEAGFEVELELGAERDEDAILRARAALAAAEGRYRAQRRADLRAGLLALSQERLARRQLADAEAEAEEAAASLAAAQGSGAGAPELVSLEVAASLAALDLEREQLGYRPRARVLAELGVADGPASGDHLLQGPVPSGVRAAPTHQQAAALALAVDRAALRVRDLPFENVREVEVTASYRAGGLQVGAELGLRGGVPTADAQLGWRSGDGAHRVGLGVSATLLLSDASSRRPSLALAELDLARRTQAAYEAGRAEREHEALRLLELAYAELHVLVVARDAAADELAAARSAGRDAARLEAAARRAEDAAERAWQRYVRALFDYLDTHDAVLDATAP